MNAASPGDTIDVSGTAGEFSYDSVTVKTSGISIVGVGGHAEIYTYGGYPSALTLDDVTDVTVSGMMFVSDGVPAVQVVGSSKIAITSDYVAANVGISPNDAMTIDGTSSNVVVTRSVINNGYGIGGSAVLISAGASGITLAADVVAAGGITATGVNGLDVTGDTIQRSCASGIDIEGASSNVFLENNLLEDGNDATGTTGGGGSAANPYYCKLDNLPWEPDVTVVGASSAGVASDYNDFYLGSDGTDPYNWSGTTYATLPSFQSATAQGAHDAVDGVQPGIVDIWPAIDVYVNATPVYTSTAVDSANVNAPGEPATDFYGVSPFNTRGAVQYVSPDPELAFSLTAQDASGFDVFLDPKLTSKDVTLSETIWWGDGSTAVIPAFSGLSTSLGVWHTYPNLGTYTIKVTITDNAGDTVTNSVVIQTAGTEYMPYGPARVLDTRVGTGTSGSTAPVAAGATVKLALAGVGGIPANVSAVALNLTVTRPTAGGYITAYPSGGARPTTSSLNFSAGQTVANMAIVPVGPDGAIDLYNGSGGTTALVADVSGYFLPVNAQGYTAATPDRILDTRYGNGGYPYPTVRASTPVRLQIAGIDGIPTGVTAVALNLTVANPSVGGYVAAFPDGQPQPTVSNVNFAGGQTIANAVIVPVGADGYIDLAIAGGPARLIADVYGYFSPSGASAYIPTWPTRLFDSRKLSNGALPAGYTYIIQVTPNVTLPASATFTGAVLNTTVTQPTAGGYLTVFPDTSDLGSQPLTVPLTSTLNFTPHSTVPNLALPALPRDGAADFYNGSGGTLQLIVDASGYFMAG